MNDVMAVSFEETYFFIFLSKSLASFAHMANTLMQCNSLIMLYDLFEQAFCSFLWSPWWRNYSKPGLYMEEIWIQNLITALLFTKNYVVNLQNLQKQASNRHHKYWDFILPSLRFTLYKLPLRSQETHHQFSPFQETKKNIFSWWQSLWICP